MNKGKCQIIDNKWQCKIEEIIYTDFKIKESTQSKKANSLVEFNLNQNKLVIPYFYYELLVLGYKVITHGTKHNYYYERIYNKKCYHYFEALYCICSGKNDFGIISFLFQSKSYLDIDLRDYVSFDDSMPVYKCKVNVFLSVEDKFIIGLKGLNNTILSFDMNNKKIEFFHKKKADHSLSIILFIFCVVLLIGVFYVGLDNYRRGIRVFDNNY